MNLKLTIELVPKSTWGISLSKKLPRSQWKRLSDEVRENAGWSCEICGARPDRSKLHAHEVWEYDDNNMVQRLVRLMCICHDCHEVKHWGRTEKIYGVSSWFDLEIAPPERIRQLMVHFCEVNGCTLEDFFIHRNYEFAIWESRSEKTWRVDFGPYSNMVRQ